MEKATRSYETTFIVNASLDDAQVDAVLGRVQETINKNGGSISAITKWGRKRLAYPISKKTNGFYINMEFEAPGALLGHLERSFQLDELVLRYLTIVLDRKAIAAKAALKAQAAAAAVEQPAAGPVPTREPLFAEPGEPKKS